MIGISLLMRVQRVGREHPRHHDRDLQEEEPYIKPDIRNSRGFISLEMAYSFLADGVGEPGGDSVSACRERGAA